MNTKPIYIYILGPTATGKTELSLRLAEKLGWPIINCDSVQVYQRVNIGTAKPSAEELKRATHFLFDEVEPPQKWTAADYLDSVVKCINKNKITNAIFVGGSGFYVQALEKGLYPEAEVSPEIKQQVGDWFIKEGDEVLYQWIKDKDPLFAEKISVNDHYRIKRAVEVMQSQGFTMTELKEKLASKSHSPLPKHGSIKLGLTDERKQLRERVEVRAAKMLEAGFVNEVIQLRSEDLHQWAPMQSVGYKEVQAFLDGEISEAELPEKIVTATMQLIKKQQTWFKKDEGIHWFKPQELDQAFEFVNKELIKKTN